MKIGLCEKLCEVKFWSNVNDCVKSDKLGQK